MRRVTGGGWARERGGMQEGGGQIYCKWLQPEGAEPQRFFGCQLDFVPWYHRYFCDPSKKTHPIFWGLKGGFILHRHRFIVDDLFSF